jgi:hypothetical protein
MSHFHRIAHKLYHLEKLASDVDTEIHAVNSGGCCVFASLVANKLIEAGIPARAVHADFWRHNITEMRKFIIEEGMDVYRKSSWERAGASFYHVGVLFKFMNKWYTMDSTAIKPGRKYLGIEDMITGNGSFTAKEAEALAFRRDNAGTWNSYFDRRQIPKMRRIINEHFKHLPVDFASAA